MNQQPTRIFMGVPPWAISQNGEMVKPPIGCGPKLPYYTRYRPAKSLKVSAVSTQIGHEFGSECIVVVRTGPLETPLAVVQRSTSTKRPFSATSQRFHFPLSRSMGFEIPGLFLYLVWGEWEEKSPALG